MEGLRYAQALLEPNLLNQSAVFWLDTRVTKAAQQSDS